MARADQNRQRIPAQKEEEDWLDRLNPAQREAVSHGDGPLLIVAGAGTGKTKTLACRVAYLIRRGVPPDRILLLTFTRRAAAEMLRRAEQLLSPGAARTVWGGTFHAVANRLLRVYAKALDLPSDFSVIDQSDAADLLNLIRNDLGVGRKGRRFPTKATLAKIYSYTVNAQCKLSDVLKTQFPWCTEDAKDIAAIFEQYGVRKRQSHALDYDDLLLYWRALTAATPVGRSVADRFEHILVDEYQDTNTIQADILQGMRQGKPGVTVVGDDAQAIYSFRAATVRNILDFSTRFPGARLVALEENYRSTQAILDVANAVMAEASERYTKELRSNRPAGGRPVLVTCLDETAQSQEVCTRILAYLDRGVPLHEQAVLFRAASHSAHLEIELARRNIPFHKYGGLRFLEAAHIKDMLAFLRILENPNDALAWFRVLQLIEGIGPRTARRIMNALRNGGAEYPTGAAGNGAVSPLIRLLGAPPTVPAAAQKQWEALRAAFADCCVARRTETSESAAPVAPRREYLPVATQIERIRAFYEPLLEKLYENPAPRKRDLEQLELIAGAYKSRQRFVTDLTLDPPASTADLAGAPHLDEDYLVLSTIHSAKGCEWRVVHILHVADGMIPSDMAAGDQAGIDEERRLLYVAMTRAKDELFLYAPLRYYHRRNGLGDGHGFAQVSRFLTAQVRALMRETVGAEACADSWTESVADPSRQLSSLWRG